MTHSEEITKNKELCRKIGIMIQEIKELPFSENRVACLTNLREADTWLRVDIKRLFF